ncbi:hypothetical protein HPE56_06125 [Maribacter sp. ANRC-HE7]|uniref:Uncharacterized protein n=1 Tax=Maribacter aquimaris TaxID=2737171 RepID=A0ABR7V2H3_9FLAO|nr:hypothetical protein [Maribacter aquimaris]MBD0777362.1 hypothetical protein [Maribacter aquimaris]
MKTKLLIIVIFLSLLTTSCVKDYTGNAGDSEDVVLTETNFSYEGDMFKFYLNSEIENLNEDISKLKKISPKDPGYNQAQKDIIEAEIQQDKFKKQIAGIIDLSEVGLKIGPDIPRPPCNCLGLRNSLEYMLILEGENIKNISLLDTNGKVLSSTAPKFTPFPEYNDQLLYTQFIVFQKIKGEVLINISKLDDQGNLLDYSFKGYVF